MELRVWDVQHGSAAYLRTPLGQHIVFDLGVGDVSQGDERFSPLCLLRESGVQRLDEVVITHPHRDHLDDIFEFDTLSPRILRRPRHLTEDDIRAGNRGLDSRIIDKYLEIDRRFTGPVRTDENPEVESKSGMQTVFFHPERCARTNLNNHSIVTFLRYANSTICLPGDNEAASWRELLDDASFRSWLTSTDVLVAAHHGREAGFCADIFEYCNPALVVASDGQGSDTSAVDKYRSQATGWTVYSRADWSSEQRFVLTTRSDGSIYIRAGWNDGKAYLEVTKE